MIEPGKDKLQIVGHLNPELEVPFGLKEYERRRTAVRELMAKAGIDTLYVSDPDSLNYLCGYKALWYQAYGHSGWGPVGGLALNVKSDKALLFDTEKERVLGGYSTIGVEFHLLRRYTKPMIEFIIDDLDAEGWLDGSVGLETDSYRPFPSLSHEFEGLLTAAGATVSDATEIVRTARRHKSSPEMAQIRKAAMVADHAIATGLDLVAAGASENFIYGEMYRALTAVGGDVPAMTPAIRSGQRTAIRNSSPSRQTIVPGDLVTLSVFGCFNRYHSFVSRSMVVGDVGDELLTRMNEAAETAHRVIADVAPAGSAGFVEQATSAFPDTLAFAGGHELGNAMSPDPIGSRYFNQVGSDAFASFDDGDAVALEINMLVPELSGCLSIGDTVLFEDNGVKTLSSLGSEIRQVVR